MIYLIILPSSYPAETLIKRWDEYTSPARFAGNDDTLDLVFTSKRRGNKVKLVRRSGTMHEPYAAVFRGNIVETDKGSEIRGIFTKSVFDYIFTFGVIILAFFIRQSAESRGAELYTSNVLLAACIIIGLFLLFNRRSAKRRYVEFMTGITGIESNQFISKRELKTKEKR